MRQRLPSAVNDACHLGRRAMYRGLRARLEQHGQVVQVLRDDGLVDARNVEPCACGLLSMGRAAETKDGLRRLIKCVCVHLAEIWLSIL